MNTTLPDLSIALDGEMIDPEEMLTEDEILDRDQDFQDWLDEAMERNAASMPEPDDFNW